MFIFLNRNYIDFQFGVCYISIYDGSSVPVTPNNGAGFLPSCPQNPSCGKCSRI